MSNSNPIPTLQNDSPTAAVRPEAESAVADLVVASGDEIKGGPSGSSTWGGSTRLNHNEPTAQDEETEPERPADLPPATDEEIKGSSGTGTFGGSTRLNHNEPTAQDEDVEPELPADLPPVADDEVKGGPSGSCTSGGSTRLNHNESVSFDDSM